MTMNYNESDFAVLVRERPLWTVDLHSARRAAFTCLAPCGIVVEG
jgi:hypothetical protein